MTTAEYSELILEARIENLERENMARRRPCEDGLSREHLIFHYGYEEKVAAQLGEIRAKLFFISERMGLILGIEAKVNSILELFNTLNEKLKESGHGPRPEVS